MSDQVGNLEISRRGLYANFTFRSFAISFFDRDGSIPNFRRSSSVSLLRSIFFLPARSLILPSAPTSNGSSSESSKMISKV